jgi:hypothetical protein
MQRCFLQAGGDGRIVIAYEPSGGCSAASPPVRSSSEAASAAGARLRLRRVPTAAPPPVIYQQRSCDEEDNRMESRTVDYGGIGWAVNHLRHGHAMRRASWPAGRQLVLDTGQTPPCVCLQESAGAGLQPWLSSNPDLLAADWELV